MLALTLTMTLTTMGCNQADPNAIAESCGDQECPVGTAFYESRSVEGSWDIQAGLDPTSYSGEIAYSQYGAGECTYTCETLYPCQDGTVPVMTEACFTCAPFNDVDGVLPGHACEDE